MKTNNSTLPQERNTELPSIFHQELERITQSCWEMEYYSDNWCPKNVCQSWYPVSIRYFKHRLRKILIEGTTIDKKKQGDYCAFISNLKQG